MMTDSSKSKAAMPGYYKGINHAFQKTEISLDKQNERHKREIERLEKEIIRLQRLHIDKLIPGNDVILPGNDTEIVLPGPYPAFNQQTINNLQKENDKLKSKLKRLSTKNSGLSYKNEKLSNDLAAQQEELNILRQNYESIVQSTDAYKQQINQLTIENEELKKQLQSDNEASKSMIDSLNRQLNDIIQKRTVKVSDFDFFVNRALESPYGNEAKMIVNAMLTLINIRFPRGNDDWNMIWARLRELVD